MEATARYFRQEIRVRTVAEMVREYEEVDTLGVILAWDAESSTGLPPVSNDYVAGVVREHPDRFIGFGSVDPHKGRAAIDETRRVAEELDLKGLKLHPGAQAFYPHERQYFPLWDCAQELGLILLFHVGTHRFRRGSRGGWAHLS